MADRIVVNSSFTSEIFKKTFKTITEAPRVLYPGINLKSLDDPVNLNDPDVSNILTNKRIILSINRYNLS